MRLIPVFLALAVLSVLPAAPAAPDPSALEGGSVEVGPCAAGWSTFWPGNLVAVGCWDDAGTELLWVSYGTCGSGDLYGATVRVLGRGVGCTSTWALALA